MYAQTLEFDQLYFNIGSHPVFLIDSDDTFIMFDGKQIIRSFDKGVTMDTIHDFTTFSNGLISPDNTLYMYYNASSSSTNNTFCLRSKDKGATWDTVHLGMRQKAIYFSSDSSMLVIPSGERKVYIYREDTLKDVFSIPAQLSNGEIFFTREDKLVGLGGGGPNTRLYSSDDLGKTWSSVPLSEEVSYLQCFEQITSNIYLLSSDSVLFYSSDTGKTWLRKWVFPSIVNCIKKTSSGNVYAFVGAWEYDDTVYRSFDFGNSWVRQSNVLRPTIGVPFVEDKSGNIYFKTNRNGVLKTSQNGDELNRALPFRYTTSGLFYDNLFPPEPNNVYVTLEISKYGHVYAGYNYNNLLSDSGVNFWEAGIVSSITNVNEEYIVTTGSLSYSADGGKNFTKLTVPDEIAEIKAYCFPKKNHISLIDLNGSCYYTTNNGLNWKEYFNAIHYSVLKAVACKSGVMLVQTLNSEYLRSTNQGRTWTPVSVPYKLEDNQNCFVAPWGDLYTMYDTLLYRSTNDGETWERLKFNYFAMDIVFDYHGQIFVCTFDGRIMYSKDKGYSFTILPTNLPKCNIFRLGLDSVGFLYCFVGVEDIRNTTTYNSGYLYRTKLPVDQLLDVESASISTDSIRLSVNPASNTTSVLLLSRIEAPVTLTVYDLEGRVKYTRYYPFIQLGENELLLDVSDLPNGIYTVLLRMSEKVMTTKLVVAR